MIQSFMLIIEMFQKKKKKTWGSVELVILILSCVFCVSVRKTVNQIKPDFGILPNTNWNLPVS